MRQIPSALACCMTLALLSGCTETPEQPDAGVQSACSVVPGQAGPGLTLSCDIEGTPANALVNPVDPADSSCSLLSFTLFEQELAASATLIYGENNEDWNDAVRIGAVIPSGQHSGRLAKSAGAECGATLPPAVQVATTFAGRHTAYVNKEADPMCVFRSRLDLSSFAQTVGVGLDIDVSLATRAGTETAIARQMDLEVARAVNGILNPSAVFTAAFEARAGRCLGDYEPFTGP
jgi:hypothetical protein